MKFWDASAIVPLLVFEPSSRGLQALAVADPIMLAWWGSSVECSSALARLEREGTLSTRAMMRALERLRQISDSWHEIDPSEAVREAAVRFLRVHPLRAADALQLAAAFVAAENRPPSLTVVSLDDRLSEAARKEGFAVEDMSSAD